MTVIRPAWKYWILGFRGGANFDLEHGCTSCSEILVTTDWDFVAVQILTSNTEVQVVPKYW